MNELSCIAKVKEHINCKEFSILYDKYHKLLRAYTRKIMRTHFSSLTGYLIIDNYDWLIYETFKTTIEIYDATKEYSFLQLAYLIHKRKLLRCVLTETSKEVSRNKAIYERREEYAKCEQPPLHHPHEKVIHKFKTFLSKLKPLVQKIIHLKISNVSCDEIAKMLDITKEKVQHVYDHHIQYFRKLNNINVTSL